MPADALARPAGPPQGRPAGQTLPRWVATAALLLPTYGWLLIAVMLPLCTKVSCSERICSPPSM